MAKKEKAKTQKDNVIKNDKVKPKSGSFNLKPLVIVTLINIVVATTAYYVYVSLISVPEMPEVKLDTWWGPKTAEKQDTSVRPFRILFTDAMKVQLSKKFEVYRSVTNRKKSLNDSWTYGINSDALAQVFAHWQFKYKIEERARFLNKFEHFKTNIQGLDIHFIHAKPTKVDKNIRVFPILLLHGWLSSVREFYDVIPLLTTVRPGYDFVFEVIAPSLPAFIYSEAPTKPGLNHFQMAIILRNLMQRLGYPHYFIQGGDFGHNIGSHIATIFPKEVLGFHTNFPANLSKRAFLTWALGSIWPSFVASGLEDRMYPLKERVEFLLEESAYMHIQGTKPDTLGIALTDSPVGLAAYILDRFMVFTNPDNKYLQDGGLSEYYTLTDLLDNIMLYWSTGSITTSMRIYKDCFKNYDVEQTMTRIPTPVPTWALRLKHELVQQPDFILRWKYPNLVGSTTLNFGGHFAAFERPKEYTDDVFLGVKKIVTQFYKK